MNEDQLTDALDNIFGPDDIKRHWLAEQEPPKPEPVPEKLPWWREWWRRCKIAIDAFMGEIEE